MKILRIYTKLPPFSGGMENHIRYLTEYQSDHGYQVTVLFNQGKKISENDVQILGSIPLHRFRPQLPGIVIFYLGIIFHLLFRRGQYDYLHIHGDWSSLLFARCLKRIVKSRKTLFSFHGSAEHYGFAKKVFLTKLTKQADWVFCTGYNSFLVMKDHPGAIFQPSGIDPVFFERKPVRKSKNITIITVARLSKVKNLIAVIAVAAKLPRLKFVLIGEGPERQRLESVVRRKALSNISMPGHLCRQELADVLHSGHIFLLSSFEEGTPTAVLEAMACGLPVVCSDAGGLSFFLESDKHGFFIRDPGDVEAYCSAVKELTDSPEMMQSIGRNNKELAKNFSWVKVGERISEKMPDA